jgi:hypothetical protein
VVIVSVAVRPARPAARRTGGIALRRATAIAAVPVLAGCFFVGPAGCGFDSSWALVWARDALHGRTAARPAGVALPTPHPLSLLWGMVAGAGPSADGRRVWAAGIELALVALLFGAYVVGSRLGGTFAGCVAVVAIAALPELGTALGSGTVDILFAALVIWSLILAPAYPEWSLALATVATLARPEGLALIVLLAVSRWRTTGARFRWEVVAAIIVAPSAWVVMGAALFADPLAALHITVANTNTGDSRHGVGSVVDSLFGNHGWISVTVAAGSVGAAWLLRKKTPGIALHVGACVAMGILLLGLSARGVAIPARYFVAELTCMLPITIGAIAFLAKGHVQRWAVAIPLTALAVVLAMATLGPRSVRMREQATQGHELRSLVRVLASDHTCGVITMAPHVFLPVVLLEANRRVHLSPTANPGDGLCRLAARDPATAAGDGWGPEPGIVRLENVPAHSNLIDADDDWVLYVS